MIAHDPQISNGVSLNYNEVSFEDLHTIFRLHKFPISAYTTHETQAILAKGMSL